MLGIAREAIARALAGDEAWQPGPEGLAPALRRAQASFVTLHAAGRLRGCIGNLEPSGELAAGIARNARQAAFADPRFPPLSAAELATVSIDISVLDEPEPLAAATEAELLAVLRPGLDGLILECGRHRGTFLPAVWRQLPQPKAFLDQLRRKAGLPEDYWSPQLRCWRYGTLQFGEGHA